MSILNTEYKKILFTRSDGVYVNLIVDINNPSDLDEDFLVLAVEKVDTPEETRLFYWINRQRWTINELNFFALNNNLCMKVMDKTGTTLSSFGNCGSNSRVFGFSFGQNFN